MVEGPPLFTIVFGDHLMRRHPTLVQVPAGGVKVTQYVPEANEPQGVPAP
jgi:hypothetical protein